MPLSLYFSPSFQRSLKVLDSVQLKAAGLILEALEVYYSTNSNLDEAKKLAPRFFYKQLRKPYFEAGVESHLRIVLKREKERRIAVLVGNHDQIRRFLANV
ncbi:MAG: hypothetical protein HY593_06485 [Candidatus Omnitrophica bacterium]|nr:hypothetical protein [Candidatus Omnitrophota bacterium]